MLHTVEEIISLLTEDEKNKVVELWSNDTPLNTRIQFIKDVLIGRLKWIIQRWNFMDYKMKLIVVTNRIIKARWFAWLHKNNITELEIVIILYVIIFYDWFIKN